MSPLVKATADGYVMNLDSIERKVDALNAKFDTKIDRVSRSDRSGNATEVAKTVTVSNTFR